MKILKWFESSFANKIIAQSLLISFATTIFLASASLLVSYKIVEGQEALIRNKDLVIARNGLESRLNQVLLELMDLGQDIDLIDGMIRNDDPEIYLQPIFRENKFREIKRYGLSLWNKRGVKLFSKYDDAWLTQNNLIGLKTSLEEGKIQAQTDQKMMVRAEVQKLGEGDLLVMTVDVISPDTRKVLGYIALEIPFIDLLSYASASEGNPREWLLTTVSDGNEFGQQKLRVMPPLDQLNLTLRFKESGKGAISVLKMLAPSFLGFIVAGLVASWLLARWIGAGLAEPILSLARGARNVVKFGRVDLQVVKSLQSLPAFRSSDEVGQLLRDESTMLEILHSLQNDLEAQVKQRGEVLNTIFDLSPDGYLEVDEFDKIGFVNPAFLAMMGFTGLDFKGLTWPMLQDFLNARLVMGEHPFDNGFFVQRIFRFSTPSMRTLMVNMRVTNVNSRILYWRDLTSEVEIGEMRKAFFAKIAHEFRSPLTSIIGFSQLLDQSPDIKVGQKESLEIITRQANNLLSLINDLLDLARLDSGQADFLPGSSLYELSALTRLVLADFKMPNDHRDFQIFLDDHLPDIQVDRGQFRQVLVNLLSNACKFSPHGSPIEIRTREALMSGVRWVVLQIKDRGVGMSDAEISQLGTPFYRTNSQEGVSGSGLGISVVREIMARHGGNVQFDSEAGVGTVVSVYFPVARKSADF